jgi:hypothetical protein
MYKMGRKGMNNSLQNKVFDHSFYKFFFFSYFVCKGKNNLHI